MAYRELTDVEMAVRELASAKRTVDHTHAAALMHPGSRDHSKEYHKANVGHRAKLKVCYAIGDRYQ